MIAKMLGPIIIFFISINTAQQQLFDDINVHNVINITAASVNASYFQEFSIAKNEIAEINLFVENITEDYGYSIVQMHSHQYELELSRNVSFADGTTQLGSSLGVVAFSNATIYIRNSQTFNVSFCVAAISYNLYAPVAGGCNLEGPMPESPILTTKYVGKSGDIFEVDTPSAALSVAEDPHQTLCSNATARTGLSYVGVYYYLPRGDFSKETYFAAIHKFLLPSNISAISSTAFRKGYKGPANRRAYIPTSGTGMLFNTIVTDATGNKAAYIPSITYFCNPFMWIEGCNLLYSDSALRVLSVILIVVGVLKSFVSFGKLFFYYDIVVNCFSLGAYFTYRLISYFDIPKSGIISLMIIAGVLASSIVFILCKIFHQRQHTIVLVIMYISSAFLFSGIFAINLMYIFEGNQFAYQENVHVVLFWILLFICSLLSCPKFGALWLIINVTIGGYYILIGIQYFSRSNLLYIPLRHFYQIRNSNINSTNGYPSPSKIDVCILMATLVIILLGIFLRKHNICLMGRRRRNAEEQPLISRKTSVSDEVFESPTSNQIFFRQQAQNSLWR